MSTPRPGGGGDIHNSPTTHGDHSIAAGNIRNVVIRWALQHPSASWLPLLLGCATVVLAGTVWPDGPASQYALWGALTAVSLGTGAARVLVRRPGDARLVAVLSLASVLATVGGWLAFRDVATHGEIDVTGKVSPQGRRTLANGEHTTLTLRIPAPRDARDALRLTLAIDDSDPAAPTCRPETYALVSLPSSGAADVHKVLPDGTADLALGGQAGTVRIDVGLVTARACLMDLRAVRATLHDE
ncbi:hypothetical protein ADL22_10320 [Streptomyces sp. NRRL F-4489]|uniref:hypothetical protein n=1 Tax=Streptomyces sp. NRRL F-4489 TaxID=1609095 RepID=UPI000749A004|nr:hypothetical protein [Streptomyces sp. NRRL F-4489]KUL47324.1 hypothetical protein ADL22_10320 [Streptomyces sp. NRRL F-4489]